MKEWEIFYSLEPTGEERMDWRFAYLIAFIGNIFRDKDAPALSPSDFMPLFEIPSTSDDLEFYDPDDQIDDDEPPDYEPLLFKVEMLNVLFNGIDLREMTKAEMKNVDARDPRR